MKFTAGHNTVTQDGMTDRQPGTSVSVTTGSAMDDAILSVSRYYKDLPNEMGGRGRFKRMDADGRHFPTSQAAWDFALDHGYIRPYFTSASLRAARVLRAEDPREIRRVMDRLAAKRAAARRNRRAA